MPEITVLIADDHPVVLRGIREVLGAAIGIEVVGLASSGEEALKLVAELEPDVLVLDMELQDMTGVQVVKDLIAQKSPVKILVLSSYDDGEYIRAMLTLGAAGYLIKDEASDLLVEAVRGVARGEKGWVSRSVAARLSDIMWQDHKNDWKLTAREEDVLRYIVAGKTNAKMAYLLKISEKTVEKHMAGIFAKLDVKSRVEAAVLAVRKELV